MKHDHRECFTACSEVKICQRGTEQRRGVTLPHVAGCGAVAPRTRAAAGAVAIMPQWLLSAYCCGVWGSSPTNSSGSRSGSEHAAMVTFFLLWRGVGQ